MEHSSPPCVKTFWMINIGVIELAFAIIFIEL